MMQITSRSRLSTSLQTQVPFAAVRPRNICLRSAFTRSTTRQGAQQRRVIVRASGGEDVDFDSLLSEIADKFEKSENKAAIIGYSFAAFFALWFSEWFIHLPVLDFLIGGTVQLLGLLLLPYFAVKYLVDNDSVTGDANRALDRVVKKLPGLNK